MLIQKFQKQHVDGLYVPLGGDIGIEISVGDIGISRLIKIGRVLYFSIVPVLLYPFLYNM